MLMQAQECAQQRHHLLLQAPCITTLWETHMLCATSGKHAGTLPPHGKHSLLLETAGTLWGLVKRALLFSDYVRASSEAATM